MDARAEERAKEAMSKIFRQAIGMVTVEKARLITEEVTHDRERNVFYEFQRRGGAHTSESR